MQVEDRTECRESGAISYKRDVANVLALEIDPAAATNKEELDEYKVYPLMASSCISSMPVCVVCSSGEPESCLNCGGRKWQYRSSCIVL